MVITTQVLVFPSSAVRALPAVSPITVTLRAWPLANLVMGSLSAHLPLSRGTLQIPVRLKVLLDPILTIALLVSNLKMVPPLTAP